MGKKKTKMMANHGRDPVAIDINALTYSSDTLVSGNFVMSPKCCIFKIPSILSRGNEKAYAPNAFSIGPWHLGKPHLKATQEIKKNYLQGLIGRSSNPDEQLRQLEDAIREVEEEAREHYAGPVGTQDLVKILILDGCFIIELFRKDAEVVPIDEDDPIYTMSCMLQFLYHDLILLENQIPWFVLELLFDMTKTPAESKPLDQLAIGFFRYMFSSQGPSMYKFQQRKSKHILDLLRNSLILESGEGGRNQSLGSRERESNGILIFEDERSNIWLPSATQLKNSGVKFRKLKSNSILDVRYEDRVLKIPTLLIHESTKTIFRNLISLEQCIPNCPPIISSYAILMEGLIATSEDEQLLREEKILDYWFNFKDATQLFNGTYIFADVKKFHYYELCNQIHEFCLRRWSLWQTILRRDYFKDRWAIINFTNGIVIITVLTSIQTICSMIQVRDAKK